MPRTLILPLQAHRGRGSGHGQLPAGRRQRVQHAAHHRRHARPRARHAAPARTLLAWRVLPYMLPYTFQRIRHTLALKVPPYALPDGPWRAHVRIRSPRLLTASTKGTGRVRTQRPGSHVAPTGRPPAAPRRRRHRARQPAHPADRRRPRVRPRSPQPRQGQRARRSRIAAAQRPQCAAHGPRRPARRQTRPAAARRARAGRPAGRAAASPPARRIIFGKVSSKPSKPQYVNPASGARHSICADKPTAS